MALEEHVAARPSWDCRACNKPWPCQEARQQALAEMGQTELAIYAWDQLETAIRDGLPETRKGVLWDRFLNWTRPQPWKSGG